MNCRNEVNAHHVFYVYIYNIGTHCTYGDNIIV